MLNSVNLHLTLNKTVYASIPIIMKGLCLQALVSDFDKLFSVRYNLNIEKLSNENFLVECKYEISVLQTQVFAECGQHSFVLITIWPTFCLLLLVCCYAH